MAGILFTDGKFQPLDSNGRIVPGGKLEVYDYETGELSKVYKDSDLNIEQTNPVLLDSAGRADVYLEPGKEYKLILKDSAGNILWSIDKYKAGGAGEGLSGIIETIDDLKNITPQANMVVMVIDDLRGGMFKWVTPDPTTTDDGVIIGSNIDSDGRWHRIYEGAVRPEWFGAKGDGLTDDSNAINTALNYPVVEFDSKTYMVLSGIYKDGDVVLKFNNTKLYLPSNATTANFPDGAVLRVGNSGFYVSTGATLSADVSAGATSIDVSDVTPFSVGDWIILVGANGSFDVSNDQYRTADIVKIVNISGSTLTLSEPLVWGYTTGTTVNKFDGRTVKAEGNLIIQIDNSEDFIGLEVVGALGVDIDSIIIDGGAYRGVQVKFSRFVKFNHITAIMPESSASSDRAGLVIYSGRDVSAYIEGYHTSGYMGIITAEPTETYAYVSDNIYLVEGGNQSIKYDLGCNRSWTQLLKAGVIQQREKEAITISNGNKFKDVTVEDLYINGDVKTNINMPSKNILANQITAISTRTASLYVDDGSNQVKLAPYANGFFNIDAGPSGGSLTPGIWGNGRMLYPQIVENTTGYPNRGYFYVDSNGNLYWHNNVNGKNYKIDMTLVT